MKKSNKWDKIHGKNEVFWIFYKMEPSRIHDSNSFGSYINSKLVCPKWWEPDLRFFSCYLWIIITSKLLKLESSETTQIRVFEALQNDHGFLWFVFFSYWTILDQKIASPFLFCHCHTLKPHTDFKTIRWLQKSSQQHEILHAKTADQDLFRSFFRSLKRLLEAEICRFRILQNAWNTL